MEKKRILIVEDDADINNLLKKILKKDSNGNLIAYEVTQAFSGTEAQLSMEKEMPDLILLDLMLPGITGESLIAIVRDDLKSNIPILVLSAKTALENKVSTLKIGADDYITKPFEPDEILARVYAALRRCDSSNGIAAEEEPEVLSYKKLQLYPLSRKVTVCDKEISFTRHEYDILYLLMTQPKKVFSRESLYEKIWNNGYYGEDNTVNVHVSNIRKKISAIDEQEEYIKTVWGIGFKLF